MLMVSTGHADPMASLPVDIAPQSLVQALLEFSRETGVQFAYLTEISADLQSKGARATQSAADALSQLLEGTSLKFEFLNARTVHIYAPPAIAVPAPSKPPVTTSKNEENRSEFRPARLGETLVTATRREEQLNKVPMSIALWTQEAMEASGVKSMTEIGALTPGVEFDYFSDYGAGVYTNISIRGVNDRNGTTVGVFLDDTPLPAPATWGGSFGRTFPVTFDLDRVEVLRGPQGTLLGEGTEGGAVRFIANQPDLKISTGLARAEWTTTAGGDPSYEIGAAAGGPLAVDAVGYRVSAWYRSDGGYVDRVDPFTGSIVEHNANGSQSKSARGALTFAGERVHITPSLTYQSVTIDDASAFYTYLSEPRAGVLKSGRLLAQPSSDSFYVASLKLSADLGVSDLIFLTSYYHRKAAARIDATNIAGYGGYGDPRGLEYPVSYANAVAATFEVNQSVLSEEVRLSSSDPSTSLTWLAGVFYSRAQNVRTGTGDPIPSGIQEWGPLHAFNRLGADETQLAGYGQVGYRVSKRLAGDVGLRIAREDYDSVFSGPTNEEFVNTFGAESRAVTADDTVVAPTFDVTYQYSEHDLYYLRVSKGYRTGGVNGGINWGGIDCRDSPSSYGPDSVWSYEIGAKNRLFEGRLQIDASVFHVSWSNPQMLVALDSGDTVCAYKTNAGHAVSYGFDLGVHALITDRLSAGLTMAYTDAHYTQSVTVDSPVGDDRVIVGNGDALGALPIVPSPWNVTAFVGYDLTLTSGVSVDVRAENIFRSRNHGPFTAEDPDSLFYAPGRRSDPSTNMLNLRADLKWPRFDLAFLVENALDSQPTLLRRNRCCQDTLFFATTFRPRTIGLTGTLRF